MDLKTIKSSLYDLLSRLNKISTTVKLPQKLDGIAEIEQQLSNPNIYEDFKTIHQLSLQKAKIEKEISPIIAERNATQDILTIATMLHDDDLSTIEEIKQFIQEKLVTVSKLELETKFDKPEDKLSCIIEINAGAGGTDSQDLVEVLLRMYTMWINRKGYKIRILDILKGEEAGIKHITLKVCGELAFGYLKHETGIHRFVRLSPFNANDKRQTSFISVFVYPLIDTTIDIKIDEKDLKIEASRSSGAGGQHVNTTDSAIRITHLPTGITVKCQSERSQVQNKNIALKMLYAKLYEQQLQAKNAEKAKIEAGKADISWGNQARNYIMHPYKLVKDLRSGYETADIQKFLDGHLDDAIESLIKL